LRVRLAAVFLAGLAAAAVADAGIPPRTPAPTRELTIAASGDLLIHSPVWARAAALGRGGFYDFRPLLARIRPIIRSADLALCHVETPMGAGAPSGYPLFNSPPGLAVAIAWTGWDACSTASNHTLDRGQYGVDATLGALDRWHVRHTGSARSRREALRILHLEVAGLDVAFLAYTYGTNGLPLPHPWSVRLIDVKRIVTDGRRARRQGADLVVINLHWGLEYRHEPTKEQVSLARTIFRRGAADVIIGQHVHVVQPIRRVLGHFVVFGEGNLLSNQSAACCPAESQDGLIALLRVRVPDGKRPSVAAVDYVPTYVRRPDYVVEPVGFTLAALLKRRESRSPYGLELRRSYWRTVRHVGVQPRVKPHPGPAAFAKR
jgi:poly-gamma-glutamate capsule biosynthesis protein CapA/YwtB (metallophosphatase superfamily)